jgi:hypothetical protein
VNHLYALLLFAGGLGFLLYVTSLPQVQGQVYTWIVAITSFGTGYCCGLLQAQPKEKGPKP